MLKIKVLRSSVFASVATILLVSLVGCSHPSQGASVISVGNASQVRQLTSWNLKGAGLNAVTFSPDGKTLATGDNEGFLDMIDATSGKVLIKERLNVNQIVSLAFSPDGKILAAGAFAPAVKGGNLWLLDATNGQVIQSLYGINQFNAVPVLTFSPDGKWLASGSADATTILWDVASRKAIHTLKGAKDVVFGVAFSPDGKILSVGSLDSSLTQFDVASGQSIKTSRLDHPVSFVTTSPDGKTLAVGEFDNYLSLLDSTSLQVLHSMRGRPFTSPLGGVEPATTVAFSPDGTVLASGMEDGTVMLWDAASGKALNTMSGHKALVSMIAFSPDGKTLVSSSYDGTIGIWGVAP